MKSYKMINHSNRLDNIKNIILVSSGKGGVGKSTVTFNLAKKLQQQGLKMAVLDADIYGPSFPTLLSKENYKVEVEQDNFTPLTINDIQFMSFGFLIDPNKAAVWRGAIVVKAIKQMLYDTAWHKDIDILLIDMPPGTGDIHLSILQHFPITAYIMVTTAHSLSLSDVKRSVEMYKKFNLTCLGFIQNMAYYLCRKCNNKDYIFGKNSVLPLLEVEYSLYNLGDIPLNSNIDDLFDYYDNIATKVLSQLRSCSRASIAIISN